MSTPGSAVVFPGLGAIDPKRIKMWDPTVPGRPAHDVGDIVCAIAPPELDTAQTGGWEFDGPLLLPGLNVRTRGRIAASYSTPERPVLGAAAVFGLRFSAAACSHWIWRGRNDPFVFVMNAYFDFANNADRLPCSFADMFKVARTGCKRNAIPGKANGPKVHVFWERVRVWNGLHYIPDTVQPGLNGHSDGLQCMGGVEDVEVGNCYLQACGGQVFFLGREAELCGFNADSLWNFVNVTWDHRPPWNPYVQPHALMRNLKAVQGYEGEPSGFERTDVGAGLYQAMRFTNCNIRGPFAKTDQANVRQYLGPVGGVTGIAPDGSFQFLPARRGRNRSPMFQGSLRYYEASETLPTVCPPDTVGLKHAVTNAEDAYASLLRMV